MLRKLGSAIAASALLLSFGGGIASAAPAPSMGHPTGWVDPEVLQRLEELGRSRGVDRQGHQQPRCLCVGHAGGVRLVPIAGIGQRLGDRPPLRTIFPPGWSGGTGGWTAATYSPYATS